jgi:hypothetical protein
VITTPVTVDFTPPVTQTGVETLILFNPARLDQIYGVGTAAPLAARLQTLAAHPSVNGQILQLDSYSAVVDVYAEWDKHADNPQAANHVTTQIKALLNPIVAYPDLKHLVIVGGDPVIPFHARESPVGK